MLRFSGERLSSIPARGADLRRFWLWLPAACSDGAVREAATPPVGCSTDGFTDGFTEGSATPPPAPAAPPAPRAPAMWPPWAVPPVSALMRLPRLGVSIENSQRHVLPPMGDAGAPAPSLGRPADGGCDGGCGAASSCAV